ncbi:MAG: DUF255 domain-containing protein [Thiohalocapsa sp.]|nr:DUF255 domain-containing protein [Thiohalocapsa sp.]
MTMPRLAAAGLLALCVLTAEADNALKGHPSPYLALHGEDPVQWRDWGPDTLAEARAENKPLLLSSGYFACHWCHVMQRESFRDARIAAILNADFIPVKIDRELHSGLDAYLVGFAERMRGQAGWPLNVFVTPAGHPFYATLYAPPDEFRALVERTARVWSEQGDAIGEVARNAARELAETAAKAPEPADMEPAALTAALKRRALAYADTLAGGFGTQTRFPMAPQLAALLDVAARAPDPELTEFLRLTLDRMAGQGLFDLIGGGFFRYTVDPGWQTPHFEKMLYTQALLVPLYLRAADVLRSPAYRETARRTLDFMLAELSAPSGAFIASLSAVDGDGVEGGYYLWRNVELAQLLTPSERAAAALAWGLSGPAELEAGNLPRLRLTPAEIAARFGSSAAAASADLGSARERLFAARAGRVLPRDDKVLAGWNGLALSALVDGARTFPDAGYGDAARRVRDVLVGGLWDGERLHRAGGVGSRQGEATLEDYAYVAGGLRAWAAFADDAPALALSRRLARDAWVRFRRDGLWYPGDDALLPDMPGARVLADAPLPAPDARLLDLLLNDPQALWRERAEEALSGVYGPVGAAPFEHASMANLAALNAFAVASEPQSPKRLQ